MRDVLKGSTDQSVVIRFVDSTDGTPETGVVAATGGLAIEYRRELGASTSIGTINDLAALTTAHTDAGIKSIGNGYYRVDLPDAAVATGANGVAVHGAATGMVCVGCYVPLVDYNPYDAVRMGLTALPNVSSGAAGAVLTSGTGTAQLNVSAGHVVNVDTITTYTGNTPQTGDNFARIGATGSGLTSLAQSADYTATRAGHLDNLNVGGLVASAAGIAAITQAQRVRLVPPSVMERPDSGSITYRVYIYAYDEQHKAEDLDSNPAVTAENNAGTDRSANLSAVTKPGATTGQYYFDYTVAVAHAIEGILFKVDATEGGVTTQYAASTLIVDTTAVDFTAADRAKLDTLHDTRIPGVIEPQTGDTFARLGVAGVGLTNLPWNATWDTEVQSEVADAFAVYDPPTEAEMNARTLVAANYGTAANQVTILGIIDTEVAAALAAVDTEVAAILAAVNSTGVVLTAAERNAITNAILDLANTIGTNSLREIFRLLSAAQGGKVSGAGTVEVTIRDIDDTKDVVVADVDADGNRTAVVLDLA